MESGILYVVYNESIRKPETNERLYKVGITKNTVYERYHGLGLKMPGEFETLFAYRLDNYTKAEQFIHGILGKFHEKGEWFNLKQDELDHIKKTCEMMGGTDVTDEVKNKNNMLAKSTNSTVEIETTNKNFGGIKTPINCIPINPNYSCKVIIFSIHKSIEERRTVYDATRYTWNIPEKYRDITEYDIAVGLVHSISLGAYKINKWHPCQKYNNRHGFEGDNVPEFESCTWYKQIELVEGYYKRGNNPIVEFDGKGKFKILRGSKDNKDQWFNCL